MSIAEALIARRMLPPEKGDQGEQGPSGPQGPEGPPGRDGKDGRDGVDGAPGPQGPAGRDGRPGKAGADGRDGQPGADGKPGPHGPPGPKGDRGPAGPPAAPVDVGGRLALAEGDTPGFLGQKLVAGAGVEITEQRAGDFRWLELKARGGGGQTTNLFGGVVEGPPGPPGATGPAGEAGPEGPAGPTGPAGPPGSGGDANYVHDQTIASATWSIAHGLGKFASVTVVDSSGDVCIGDVLYVDTDHVQVAFSAPFSGHAYLN